MTRDPRWNDVVTVDLIISNSIVDQVKGCWIWTGQLSEQGYARYGKNGGAIVSRISWEHKHGRPMREGYYACHTCDVEACVFADHIYEGTSGDNMRDAWARTRVAPRRVTQKLTDAQVKEIIARGKSLRVNKRGLARQYNVSHATINKIISRERFKDLQ